MSLDTVFSVGCNKCGWTSLQIVPGLSTAVFAIPKGAYGTTDEDLFVLMCACSCD